jgi:hypothetical protein
LYQSVLPEICVQAGVMDQEQCRLLAADSDLDQACVSQGLQIAADCQIFLAKKQSQQECISAGKLTAQSCKTYLFLKYGYAQDLDGGKNPSLCKQAGTPTAAACQQLLIDNFLPLPCLTAGLTNVAECKYFIEQIDLPAECTAAGIKSQVECNTYMLDKFGTELCAQAGISDKKECRSYLFNRFINNIKCSGQDNLICRYVVENQYLGYVVAKQLQFRALNEFAQKNRGLSVAAGEFIASDITKNITPIKDNSTVLKILSSEQNLVLNGQDELVQTSPVMLMVDADGDSLPDDIEKSIGTGPNNPDSDGDGYYDGDEVRGGYDPLGPGKKTIPLAPAEEAIVAEKTIGHPKAEGIVSDKFQVASVNSQNNGDLTEEKYVLSGQGEPNSTITLYLYSDLPLVALVKTDAYGNWQYEIDRPLQEGGHEVYATINDNTGKILEKSAPFQFFIKEAKALSPQDFIANNPAPSKTDGLLSLYIAIAGLIILSGIVLFIGIYYFNKKGPSVKY